MHRDQCLLYASGEMSAEESGRFQSHLGACPDCRGWLELVGRGAAWAGSAAENAPTGVLVAVLGLTAAAPVVAAAKTGLWAKLPGWLKWVLLTAVASAALRVAQGPRDPVPEPAPAFPSNARLEIPSSGPAPRPSEPPRGSQDLVAGPLEPTLEKPDVLECKDPASIRAFKRWVIYDYQAFPEDGDTAAEDWSACLCGPAAAAAGMPALPPRTSSTRKLPGCPSGKESVKEPYIAIAKFFYEALPITQEQAVKMPACYCGPSPRGR
ncbi:MAG: zf-HC2 domain-containing protein [Elusimicrobia bacterium]|nr:zf-HC2 domain-containing protein [Elusimicrobiota bacterium]